MILAIHQPSYWPWLGLLDKIASCDVLVILDNVALNKDSYQRRNIFLVNGKPKHLTIPIDYHMGIKINDALIMDQFFAAKHLETLQNWYRGARYFDETIEYILSIYQNDYKKLIEVLMATIFASMKAFGISTQVILASKLNSSGSKGTLVLSICKELKTKKYLSGKGALGYFQEEDYQSFKKSGIEILFQEFKHPIYHQVNSKEFVPGLGCLDILFNCGLSSNRAIFNK